MADKVLTALRDLSADELVSSMYAIIVHLYHTDNGWDLNKDIDSDDVVFFVCNQIPDEVFNALRDSIADRDYADGGVAPRKVCKHEADFLSVQTRTDGSDVFDVSCKLCGCSGSFREAEDILWPE